MNAESENMKAPLPETDPEVIKKRVAEMQDLTAQGDQAPKTDAPFKDELTVIWAKEKEKLKAQWLKYQQSMDYLANTALRDQQAEIERLNNKLEQAGLIIADCGVESFKIKALITELCDALEQIDVVEYKHADLLQRAREVLK